MADNYRSYWNDQFRTLQNVWPKAEDFESNMEKCLTLHAMVHSAGMADSGVCSFEDELFEKMTEEVFREVVSGDQSVAWKLWHIARIEDITMNILIAGDRQVAVEGGWFEKLGCRAKDTGNAMDEEEITALSRTLDMQALREYRSCVGKKTRLILQAMKTEDLKRKVEPDRLQRMLDEGAVVKEAVGLLDYWGRKTCSGLLLMPATRHNLVHLNESMRRIK